MAVSFRNSPKLPKYSSIDVSLRDFWPQYFFHPLFIVQGRSRAEEGTRCGKKKKSRMQGGMSRNDKGCLCRNLENSPRSRHEKAVGVSTAEPRHFAGAEAKNWLAQDRSGP